MTQQLTAFVPADQQVTGANENSTRPVTEGTEVNVTDDNSTQSTNYWSWLDDVGSSVSSAASTVFDAYAQRAANRVTGAESSVDSTGDVSDQTGPQNIVTPTAMSTFETYKTPIIVGAIVVSLLGVMLIAGRK